MPFLSYILDIRCICMYIYIDVSSRSYLHCIYLIHVHGLLIASRQYTSRSDGMSTVYYILPTFNWSEESPCNYCSSTVSAFTHDACIQYVHKHYVYSTLAKFEIKKEEKDTLTHILNNETHPHVKQTNNQLPDT